MRRSMETGHFYFIKDEFYNALPNCNLMTNKPDDFSGQHGRPCHYCFEDNGVYWMVPISSQVAKYETIYNHKIEKYGECDGIVFGFVNGRRSAFLIQNSFPITLEYIDHEYLIEKNTVSVTVNERVSDEINKYVRKVIRLHKKGITTTFTKLDTIFAFLGL